MKKATRGPGRPMAQIKVPNRKFTFADLKAANTHVTPLTLRKFLARDAARKGKSEIVLVKDETREPNSKKGLGRKTYVYIPRSKADTLKSAAKSKVSVKLGETTAAKPAKSYEATKAALGITTPAATPTPEAAPEVTPAPVESAAPAEAPAAA